MKFYVGDVVMLRKPHPCGTNRWEVLRTGMDFRIRCLGCGHWVMLPRRRFERAVKRILQRAVEEPPLPGPGSAAGPSGALPSGGAGPAPEEPPAPAPPAPR